MITILKLSVSNVPGVLDRIASMIRHNAWNIEVEGISVGKVLDSPTTINILFESGAVDVGVLIKRLSRLDFVRSWEECTSETHLIRELVILKLRGADYDAAPIPDAEIIHRMKDTIFVQYVSTTEAINKLLLDRKGEILDCVRSGGTAIARMEETAK